MKRTLCLFLALILAVGICFSAPVTITASAAEAVTSGTCGATGNEDSVTWVYDSTTTTLTISGTGAMADFNDTLPWSSYSLDVTKIIIGEGVTSIDEDIFNYWCYFLESIEVDENNAVYLAIDGVLFDKNKEKLICYPAAKTGTSYTIPGSVETIADYAFKHCTLLTSVTISDSVTTIGREAFYDCLVLESITIPDSATTIGENAFMQCVSLRLVEIGKDVTSIGNNAFNGCGSLESIEVDESNNVYSDINGVLFDKNKEKLICYPAAKTGTSYDIPNSVETIADYAFKNCTSLTSVTIPQTVTSIGNGAFYGWSNLTSMTIPDGVTIIGDEAFRFCRKLKEITILGRVGTIGNNAFGGCDALTTVNVPCGWDTENSPYEFDEGVLEFAEHCYDSDRICTKCGNLPAWISKTVVNEDFSVTFFVEYDDSYGPCDSNLQFLVNDGDQEVGLNINYDSQQGYYATMTGLNPDCKGITLTAQILLSGMLLEHEKARTTVVVKNPDNHISDNYTYIDNGDGTHSFECTVCGTVTESHTFTDDTCSVCGVIGGYCGATENDNVIWSFDDSDGTLTISGSGAMATYGFATPAPWSTFYTTIENVVIEKGVTNISDCAFSDYYSNIKSITISGTVESIGQAAFYKCTSLTSVTIPDSVTSIANGAFQNCTALTSVTIPDSVTTIAVSAFQNCTTLTLVTIPDSVTTIGDNAFNNCTNVLLFVDKNNSDVQTYAINNSINYVVDGSGELGKLTFTINEDGESYSVTDCDTSITGLLTIPSKYNGKPVTEIGYRAFANCENLTSVVIPDSVISLGEMAFYVCGSLETVTLSSNISVIPNDAFAYCESLKTLPITENIKDIGERAFYDSGEHGSVSLSGVTIGSEAFRSCGITELILENCELNDTDIFTNNDIEELVLLETDVPDEMFDGHAYIKTLVAEDSVLGSRSFANCSELKSVTVSGGEINNDAFVDCSLLETVTIDNVDSVGEYAFNNCQNLKTIVLYTREISKYAFSMCTSLESVKLSDGVEVIGDAVFEGCTSLAELELPETVTKIGKRVFNGCNSLTELVIPESVTDVSAEAFAGCFNLKYVFFVGNEEDIGNEYIADAKIHYGSSTHTFNENYTVDLEPTCTENGSESQHCKYCDLTQNERPVKENGHTSVNGGTEKAHTICDVCKEVLSTTHNITSKVTTQPTCTKEGVETFTCECGYTYTKPAKALNHDLVSHAGKAATCTENGYYPYNTCSRCDYTTYKEDAATGHNYSNEFTVDKEATPIETGLKSRHCTRCDAKTDETVIEKTALSAPVISSAIVTTSGVKITWSAVPYAAKYKVYRKTYHPSTGTWDSKWKKINKVVVSGTEYIDTTVKLGTQYMYLIKAVNGDVKKNSAASTVVEFKISPTPTVLLKSNGIKVKWAETVVSAENYRIYRAEYNETTKKYGSYKKVKTVKGTTKSWTDTKVKSGKKYKYCVKAVRGSVVCTKVETKPIYYLTKPEATVVNATNGIIVNWTQAKGASKYRVYRSELQNGVWSDYKEIATPNGKTKTYTDTTAAAGVQYKYKVKAVKSKTGIVSSATNAITR